MIEIKNERLAVGINPVGAELEYVKIDGINILWSRSELWNQQSPVLFPIIGCLKDNYYMFNNQKYILPPHGFIMNECFKAVEVNDSSLILEKSYDENTLKSYPFRFKLQVITELKDTSVKVSYKIYNLDDIEIPASIGIHPGFSFKGLNALLGQGYSLDIEGKFKEVLFNPSFISGYIDSNVSFKGFNDLSNMLVSKRTLCYKGMNDIKIFNGTKEIRISHDMDYVAFWQKNPESGGEFMCIEGWCGLPDSANSNHNIYDKDGIIIVKKGEEITKSFTISYK